MRSSVCCAESDEAYVSPSSEVFASLARFIVSSTCINPLSSVHPLSLFCSSYMYPIFNRFSSCTQPVSILYSSFEHMRHVTKIPCDTASRCAGCRPHPRPCVPFVVSHTDTEPNHSDYRDQLVHVCADKEEASCPRSDECLEVEQEEYRQRRTTASQVVTRTRTWAASLLLVC
jgi:hypothetical protein